jgi:hypothetical protein
MSSGVLRLPRSLQGPVIPGREDPRQLRCGTCVGRSWPDYGTRIAARHESDDSLCHGQVRPQHGQGVRHQRTHHGARLLPTQGSGSTPPTAPADAGTEHASRSPATRLRRAATAADAGIPSHPAAFHTSKNRLHLDLAATDRDAEISKLAGLGATPIRDIEENGDRWVAFADPEGNEFDLTCR